jgi:outer membrane immunogenic protein
VNYQVAAYVVGFLPLTPKAELFARVGYGRTEVETEWSARSLAGDQQAAVTSHSDTWNCGLGGQYHFDDKNGVRLDYTRHDASSDGSDIDAWSIGYTRRF